VIQFDIKFLLEFSIHSKGLGDKTFSLFQKVWDDELELFLERILKLLLINS